MNIGFDMHTEVAQLAKRIVAPVAVRLERKELDTAVVQIRRAFGQLSTNSAPANVDFENVALKIIEPVREKLSEAEFARVVDRLQGAMAGFSQRDAAEAQPDAEPSGLQEQREALHLQQNAEPANAEPWWSVSEQAMWLRILIWLCTEIHWQLH